MDIKEWIEIDNIIYFTIITNGMTGREWLEYFRSKRIEVGKYAESMFLSPFFKPTEKGRIKKIGVLKGESFSYENRIESVIRCEAFRRNMFKPDAEDSCLIRDKFSDEKIKMMGFDWIITMHNPILDCTGSCSLLCTYSFNVGKPQLNACYNGAESWWLSNFGFSFEVEK